MLVLEPQGAQVCQWRKNFDLLYLLAEIQATYLMKVEKDGWMRIYLLCRDWLISFMWATSAVLPWRHFDLNVLLKKQTTSLCINYLLGAKLCQFTIFYRETMYLEDLQNISSQQKTPSLLNSGLFTSNVSQPADFSIRNNIVK